MTSLGRLTVCSQTDRKYRILLHYHIFIPVKTPLKIVPLARDIFKFKYVLTALKDFLGARV